jgi:putative glutathione S-transferase
VTSTEQAPPAGAFRRVPSRWRNQVEIEPGRYHLYVSLACPWAHRTIIVRALSGLEADVPMTIVDPVRDERGWALTEPDPSRGWTLLSEAYFATDPAYDGRVSVPVLWDVAEERIACNESADVIVSLNAARRTGLDLYPEALRPEIDAVNDLVYENVNDGVYRCGFARGQEAYDIAVERLFETLGELDRRLGEQRFLVGDGVTLADWRLFTTLLRFDLVYHTHFKATVHRLVEYPNLWPYARSLYQWPGVRETVSFDHIRRHYYLSHRELNPRGIVPALPAMDWDAPHGRA